MMNGTKAMNYCQCGFEDRRDLCIAFLFGGFDLAVQRDFVLRCTKRRRKTRFGSIFQDRVYCGRTGGLSEPSLAMAKPVMMVWNDRLPGATWLAWGSRARAFRCLSATMRPSGR
ncbi:MAG: hypothetical protein P0Y66_09145 [Candidatus Kaistia colombiensis]|nr:MAG: hypothetical protein P0Y66_09145 [Kaistia sp.]